MTREEHIAKAEKLLAGEFHPSSYPGGAGWHGKPTEKDVALAQVHATLAVALTEPERPRWRWSR